MSGDREPALRIDPCVHLGCALPSTAGPNSREIMQRLTDVDMSHEAFKFLDCRHNMAVGPARMTYVLVMLRVLGDTAILALSDTLTHA